MRTSRDRQLPAAARGAAGAGRLDPADPAGPARLPAGGRGRDVPQGGADNRVREVVTPAARGQILDDRGQPLVSNRTALVVSVTRSIVRSQPTRARGARAPGRGRRHPGRADRAARSRRAGSGRDGAVAPRRPAAGTARRCSRCRSRPTARTTAPQVRKVLAIEEHAEDFPGISARYAPVREYPQGSLAAHVLGYLGPLTRTTSRPTRTRAWRPARSSAGPASRRCTTTGCAAPTGAASCTVDKDATVTGNARDHSGPGRATTSCSRSTPASRRSPRRRWRTGSRPRASATTRTRAKNFTAPNGAAIVVDVRNGQVVAMASYPTYDPALFVAAHPPSETTPRCSTRRATR